MFIYFCLFLNKQTNKRIIDCSTSCDPTVEEKEVGERIQNRKNLRLNKIVINSELCVRRPEDENIKKGKNEEKYKKLKIDKR